MTLAQSSSPNLLSSLLAVYSDHIYRNQPTMIRENKPLISLWAQWYIGLMVPPLMLALLTQEKALDVSPEHFHAGFTKPDASPVSGSMCVKIKTQHHIRRSSEWKR